MTDSRTDDYDLSDRYDLRGEIGQGGMGTILSAFDQDVRREVAIKTLRNRSDPQALARFIQEAQVTGQLEHPNIVPVHDVAVGASGQFYFTMKRVRGNSLDVLIQRARAAVLSGQPCPLTLVQRLDIFRKVLDALEYAHSRGVIHRDLKPGNIMVGEFGEVLLMDWGLARIIDAGSRRQPSSPQPPNADTPATWAESTTSTREIPAVADVPQPEAGATHAETGRGPDTSPQSHWQPIVSDRLEENQATHHGQIIGTPGYMAIEQVRGHPDLVDRRSDIYSLGAVLYDLLTLTSAYPGNAVENLAAQVEGLPEPARQRVARVFRRHRELLPVPRELWLIARRCLQRDPKDRYPSVNDVRRDIDAFLGNEPVSVAPDSLPRRFVKWVRRQPTLAAVCGMAVVFAAVALMVAGLVLARDARQTAARQLAESRADTSRARAEAEASARLQAESDARAARAEKERAELEVLAREGRLQEIRGRLIGQKKAEVQRLVDELRGRWSAAMARGVSSSEFFAGLSDPEVAAYRDSIESLIEESETSGETLHNARHLMMLALLYHMRLGNPEKAEEVYTQALELDPQLWEAYCNRGIVRTYSGNFDGALADYDTALGMRRDAQTEMLRAEILGFFRLQEQLEAHPDDIGSLVQRGHFLLGNGRYREAIDDFTRAIELGATSGRAQELRGAAHYSLGNFAAAIEDLQYAARKLNDAEIWVTLSDMQRNTMAYKDAIESATRALELRPGYWRAHVNRGYSHRFLGNRDEALADMRAALPGCTERGWAQKLARDISQLSRQ